MQLEEWAGPRDGRAWSFTEVFAQSRWQSVRVPLKARRLKAINIEPIHDRLCQGWLLLLAETNVAVLRGHFPIKARRVP